jgi:hypothetical protein
MLFPLVLDDMGNPHVSGHQLYLICRWSTLVAMVMHLLAVDNADEINCQVRSR